MPYESIVNAAGLIGQANPETRLKAIGLAGLIVAAGVLGILVIIALLATWRRAHRRESKLEEARRQRQHTDLDIDAWQSASQRLGEVRVERPDRPRGDDDDEEDEPPPYDNGYGNDDEPPDDDDDDDRNAPWRESL